MDFTTMGLHVVLQKALQDLGFAHPTPIQREAIRFLLENKQDLIALANTGTGKTAAFGLPLLQNIEIADAHPQAIVLCPTRELCLQISNDFKSYAKYLSGMRIVPVYGGASITVQVQALRGGAQVVVGTPGRVLDLVKRKRLKLSGIKQLVLDEADEMLNMGFKEDLDQILSETPQSKQTLLFSATMPRAVLQLTKHYMNKPHQIAVDGSTEGVKNIEHHYYVVKSRYRYQALRSICDMAPEMYGIIFCRTRRDTQDVAGKLMQDGYHADTIHGELSQAQRDQVMGRFRRRQIQLLVATDVAARGIDIDDLSHVINFNLPDDNAVYVHRSGRTGRAGKTGISVIIAHRGEVRKIHAIARLLECELTLKQVPSGDDICNQQIDRMLDNMAGAVVKRKMEKYWPTILQKLEQVDQAALLKHLLVSKFDRLMGSYAYAEDINETVQSSGGQRTEKGRGRRTEKKSNRARLFINLGKQHDFTAQDFPRLLQGKGAKSEIAVKRIEVLRKFSFFEVEHHLASEVFKSLMGVQWQGRAVYAEMASTAKERKQPSQHRGTPAAAYHRKKKPARGGRAGRKKAIPAK